MVTVLENVELIEPYLRKRKGEKSVRITGDVAQPFYDLKNKIKRPCQV